MANGPNPTATPTPGKMEFKILFDSKPDELAARLGAESAQGWQVAGFSSYHVELPGPPGLVVQGQLLHVLLQRPAR